MKFQSLMIGATMILGATTSCKAQGYNKTPNGLEFKYDKKGNGTYVSKPGDIATVNVLFRIGDSLIMDTKKMNNNQPVDQPLQKPSFRYDLFEGLLMMKDGDKMNFRAPADSMFALAKQPLPEWVKPGSYYEWDIEMVKVKSKEQAEKEQAEKAKASIAENEKEILAYLKTNKISVKPLPTKPVKANPKVAYKDPASGIYYVVTKDGTGAPVGTGKNVSVNYTGKLMDGTAFDSNVDPKFNHVEPIKFTVGQGQMIKGWDVMAAKMKVGDKYTVFLPAAQAYGERGTPDGRIKPFSVLMFDMEMLNAE